MFRSPAVWRLALCIASFPQTVTLSAEFKTQVSTPVQVATGFAFTEGPVSDNEGGIWFTDIPNARILRFDTEAGASDVIIENSGGANGLAFDAQGRLLAAEGITQQLTRRDGDQVEVLADTWNGMPLNSPNDMVIDSFGGVYFTDPGYYHQVQTEAVYYLSPAGELSQIISDLDRPNGIALSPDESALYVADPGKNPTAVRDGPSKIMQYDLVEPGRPTNGRVFAQWFADGLTVDRFGNVFAATYVGFAAWTPDGEELFWKQTPSATTNLAFENPDGGYPNVLYITAGGSLYRTEMLPDITGDTDADGDVDIDDLNNVRNHFGGTGLGDTNGDGQVNIDDLNAVRNHFGAGAVAVPEPGGWVLAVLGLAAGCAARRVRRNRPQPRSGGRQ